jgi:hypothetical protein
MADAYLFKCMTELASYFMIELFNLPNSLRVYVTSIRGGDNLGFNPV